jgi:DNA adenine methylase
VIINDIDRSIYAFWFSVLNYTDDLCEKIRLTDVNVEEWKKQKEVQHNKENANLLELGFSTFFLNRTNRSGIIKGGIIGGKNQDGYWKIDARYNKEKLIERIETISKYKDKISLYQMDAIDFLNSILPLLDKKSLIYFDPPYYNQGSALYVNYYKHQDHKNLSKFIQKLNCKWILTYDYVPEILEMYKNVDKKTLSLRYSAAEAKSGKELIAFSKKFEVPTQAYSSIKIE